MRLKKEFVTISDKDGSMTVSTDTKLFSGMAKGNGTASFILKCMEEDISIEELVRKVCSQYEADPDVVKSDLNSIIDKLRSINAIEE